MHWILVILALIFLVAISAGFKKQTGVSLPSTKAVNAVRRRARKAGKHEWQAVVDYMDRKQKRKQKD